MRPPAGDRRSTTDVPREKVALASPPPLAPAHRTPPASDVPAEIEFDPAVAAGVPPTYAAEPAEEISEVSFDESGDSAPSPELGVKHVRVGSNVDILAELERLRKNSTSLSPALRPSRRAASGISVDDLLANSLNHRKEVSRVYDLAIPRKELASGEQVTVTLAFQDRNNRRVGEERSFEIPLETQDLEKLLLSLKFQIFGK
jgi:hypothetical protein